MPFEFSPQDGYVVLILKGICNGDEKPSVLPEAEKVISQTNTKYMVINCSECGGFGIAFLRSLAQIYVILKKVNGAMRLVNVEKGQIEMIKRSGLDRILVCKMSMRGALVDFGLVKAKEFDVNFINPFLSSTQRVMKVQCFLETTAGQPFLKKPTDPMLYGDISGIIGITSETFSGTLAISFTEKIFIKIAHNVLGKTYEKIESEIVDLAGEISNIILGQAKLALAPMGYKFQAAIPSCVWGKDHQIKHFGGGICVCLPFETPEGTFHVEIMSNQATIGADGKPKAA